MTLTYPHCIFVRVMLSYLMNYDDDEDDFPLANPHSVGCQSNGFLIDFYPHPASL